MHTPSLTSLFTEFPFEYNPTIDQNVNITSITADSRLVKPGSLFMAMSGGEVDGHIFIPNAIKNGAVAVVGEKPIAGLDVPYIQVENSRQSMASLAAAFYGFPARKLTMIGITGTDGKTTTCNILYRILMAAGYKTGLISTVNAVIGSEVLDTGFHVTTPDAPEVQRYLAKMVEAGLTHVILETTSHGWAQYRVDACEFDIGIVTNITHEHLDYHGSFEKYREAKARMFTSLEATKTKVHGNIRLGVLNYDDSSYEYIKEKTSVKTISYGISEGADISAGNINFTPDGMNFSVNWGSYDLKIATSLLGTFNISNCLAALAAALAGLGIGPSEAARGIADLAGVPGRMERIDLGQDFCAIVDFAHTPNALKVSLETARQILAGIENSNIKKLGRVLVIFGSAGLRDKEKRRMMAEISAELADIIILTTEDPRTEILDDILEEMARGALSRGGVEGKNFWRVRDRGEAIRKAVKMARAGDLVLTCGKGHEQSMCFGTIEYSWDDRTALRAALAEHLGLEGPLMPYLPTSDGRI